MGKKQSPKRPSKLENVASLIRQRASEGDVLFSPHAKQRQGERKITLPEAIYVLETGKRNLKKDEWKDEHKSWNYAIDGSTIDDRNLRVAVAFSTTLDMLIVTLIDLD